MRLTFFLRPLFMRGSVEADQCEGVYVPHAVDASEEGAGVLQRYVLVPLPPTLRYLVRNKS